MKKLSLIFLSALACWGFVSCESYDLPNPPAQSNPQPPVLDPSALKVTSDVTDQTYSLQALEEAGQNIELATITPDKVSDEIEYRPTVFFSLDDFKTQIELPASVQLNADSTSYSVFVTPAALQKAYVEGISKNPKEKTLDMRMLLSASAYGQEAIVGGPDHFYISGKINILPCPAEIDIESAYYIIGTSDGDWNFADAIKFSHSDADVYDDPVFTTEVTITPEQAAAGWQWLVIPQSTYAEGKFVDANGGKYGVETSGTDARYGNLLPMKVDKEGTVTFEPGIGCIRLSGTWTVTINLEEGTYSFASYLYTPGESNGWSQIQSQRLTTENCEDYYGYAYLSGTFKFTSAPDWNGTNYGAGATPGTLSTDVDAKNLTVPAPGLYYCNVSVPDLTYEFTLITTIGVIGDATPSGWGADTALTPSDNGLVWSGTMDLKTGTFKFRANNDWDINLGGSLNELTLNGDNITSPGDGTYEITLSLKTLPYTATIVAK